MERFVNIELLRNPYNWVIVILMVAIAGLALPLIFPAQFSTEKG